MRPSAANPTASPAGKSPPVLDEAGGARRPRRNYARWRALSLSLVYVLFAVHVIHWKVTGTTLAPLELNEVMYTIELGIITAGFCFMCLLVLGTLIFGRFFCSWACHILALQDLCGWMLGKLRIRLKPIRSRVLLVVPLLTAFYMFVWPQVLRTWRDRAFPEFRFSTDADGWASFVTDNFWRNLPTLPIVVLTFAVCGFAIVYLLGSRTFCAYVCPYGAVFALADRLAPGRIRVNDACVQCGTCTSVCKSGVRVHKEVYKHGMVVDPACMKDLDCVAACPQNALRFQFGKPSLVKSLTAGGRVGLRYDFSIREELLVGLVFVVVLLSFRGLYSRLPFLLSLALGGIIGYLAVLTVRLFTRPEVTLSTVRLGRLGRLTLAGRAFCGMAVLVVALVGHSAFVRYHEYCGLRQTRDLGAVPAASQADALAARALDHLTTADRWGLLSNPRVQKSLLTVSGHVGEFADVETYALRLLADDPDDADTRVHLGQALAAQRRWSEAEREFRTVLARKDVVAALRASAHLALAGTLAVRGDIAGTVGQLRAALALDPKRPAVHAELGAMLAEMGQFDQAVAELREALALDPQMARAHYNLGTLLAHLGRFGEAVPCYERALAITPNDAEVHNNLGFALSALGRVERARDHLERAGAIKPNTTTRASRRPARDGQARRLPGD